jgi:multiple sugar transport system substrate-binding protein
MTDTTTSRRQLLRAGVGLAAGGLAAPPVARAQSGFDWRRFSGQTIEVTMQRIFVCDVLQRHQKEFEEQTGIKVQSEQIPEQQLRQKLVMDFASGTPGVDVCFVAYASQKRLFGKAQWLADLRPLIKDPNLTPSEFDFADFTQPAIAYATQKDGRLDTLPIAFAYNVIMWNKELFAAKGLNPPTTFTEVVEAARKLHDPAKGISGFITRGMKNANVIMWTSFLLGYGVDPLDDAGNLRTDGPEAIAAAKLYQELMRDYAPSGVIGYNWNECLTTFMLGRAAMYLDTTSVGQPVDDPARSKIAGKAGFAVMPAGPKAHYAPVFGDGFGVASTSKHKEAAWLYCQWATGKVNQARLLAGGYGGSARKSAYAAIAASADVTASKGWLEADAQSAPIARSCLPEIVSINQFRDTFGEVLCNMLGNADPATELHRATEEFKPVLAQTG